jgi:hypothetical protein
MSRLRSSGSFWARNARTPRNWVTTAVHIFNSKALPAVGAAIGALIFGMVNQGIVYAGWNPDWFQFFVGALLLGAILLNTYIRRRAEASI